MLLAVCGGMAHVFGGILAVWAGLGVLMPYSERKCHCLAALRSSGAGQQFFLRGWGHINTGALEKIVTFWCNLHRFVICRVTRLSVVCWGLAHF